MHTHTCATNLLSAAALVFSTTLLVACASSVKESERDTASTYRGFWGMTIADSSIAARTASTRWNCFNLKTSGNLSVAGGHVSARINGYDLSGYVRPDGAFTATRTLGNGWRYNLVGNLDASTGTGIAKLYYNREFDGHSGCHSRMMLEKTRF